MVSISQWTWRLVCSADVWHWLTECVFVCCRSTTYVELLVCKLGVKPPNLSAEQSQSRTVRWSVHTVSTGSLPPPRTLCLHLCLSVRLSVCLTVYLSVCLFVCLLTGLLKNYWWNLYEISWNSWTSSRDQSMRLWATLRLWQDYPAESFRGPSVTYKR